MAQALDPDFLEAARQTNGTRANAATGALYDHAILDPDKEAENRKLARRIGAPVASVRNVPEEAKVEAKRIAIDRDLYRQIHSAPNVARWIAKDDNAAVAQDDVDILTKIGRGLLGAYTALTAPATIPTLIGTAIGSHPERSKEFIRKSPRALGAGAAGAAAGIAGAVEGVAEATDKYSPVAWAQRKVFGSSLDGGVADLARRRRQQWTEVADDARPTSDSFVVSAALSGIESVPLSVGAAVATLATKNPLTGAAILGIGVGGQSYGEARDAGLTVEGAGLKAGVDVGVELATEYGPQEALAGVLGTTPLKRALRDFVLKEMGGEQAATLGQDFNQWALIDANKGKTFDEYLAEIGPHAMSTAIATATTTGAISAIPATLRAVDRVSGRFAVREARAAEAAAMSQHLEGLGQLAAASRLRERDPESFREFIADAAEDGPVEAVYVAADKLGEVLNQSGIEPEQRAALEAALAPHIENALATGTEIKIPVEDFATYLGDEKALLDHVKIDPNGMSRAEAQDFITSHGDQLKADVEEALAEARGQGEFAVGVDRVQERFFGELEKAKRFTSEVNRAYAMMHAAFVGTNAAKMGLAPEEFDRRFALRVQAEGTGELSQSLDDVKALAKSRKVELDLTESDDAIGLEWLARKSNKRGAKPGAGRDVLAALIRYADATGKRVELSVYRGNPKLVDYYRQHGFEITAKDDPLAPVMVREPKELSQDGQRNRGGRPEQRDGAPLADAPKVGGKQFGPIAEVVAVAQAYARQAGIPFDRQSHYAEVDLERAKRIADAYEAMPHAPNDPAVRAAYEDMARQTRAQYDGLVQAGFVFEFGDPDSDYFASGWNSLRDLRDNKRMLVFPTAAAFGSNDAFDPTGNPLLADTGLTWRDHTGTEQPVTYNDLFRAVHDAFGHGLEGAGFRAHGEENAWQAHARLYTMPGLAAMTTETRGQNSWLNYGPHGEANQTASVDDTVFGDQKAGLLPEWAWTEGRVDDGELFQSTVPYPFQSALTLAVEASTLKKASGQQWLATLSKTPGIKKEELEWTGLPEWLASGPLSFTRDEVLAFVKANGVQVEEIVKSDDYEENQEAIWERESELQEQAWGDEWEAEVEEIVPADEEVDTDTIDLFDPDYARQPNVVKFVASFNAPSFYGIDRAVASALPNATSNGSHYSLGEFDTRQEAEDALEAAKWDLFNEARGAGWGDDFLSQASEPFMPKWRGYVTRPDEGEDYTELLLTLPPGVAGNPPEGFTGSHWDEPGVVAHIRFDTRYDAERKQVLAIHEIQSDWHQIGTKRGYKVKLKDDERARLQAEFDANEEQYYALMATPEYKAWREEDDRLAAAVKSAGDYARALGQELLAASGITVPGSTYANDFRQEQFRALVAPEHHALLQQYFDAGAASEAAGNAARASSLRQPHRDELAQRYETRHSLATKMENRAGIPDAPFKGMAYATLALKRAIRWAVDHGHDRIVWIRGEQQNGANDAEGAWFYDRNLINIANDVLKKAKAGKVERFNVPDLEPEESYEYETRDPGELEQLIAEGQRIVEEANPVLLELLTVPEDQRDEAWHLRNQDLTTEIGNAEDEIDELREEQRRALNEREVEGRSGHYGFDITPELAAAAQSGFTLFQQNRGAYSPATDTITLLKSADLSTFLHESGHFYLEVMDRLAADPNAPQDIRDDFDTVLKWFGVADAATWRGLSLEQKRPHHEKWARGFEAYLFTGKPPSLKLQALFQRFRAWLIAVYRKATALGVQPTPAIRGVMDRMLATADEIAIAESARSMLPLFKDREASGLDENGWREYQRQATEATSAAIGDLEARSLRDMQWIANARGREIDKLKRQSRSIRKQVTQAVTREVMAEPVYRAMDYLKRGVLDGQPVEGPHKLYTPEIREQYGEEAAQLIEQLRGMTSTDNGIHPAQLAELFGFTSVDHMLVELTSAEPIKDKIAGLVEQRLLEDHGDLTDEKAIEEAADRAIHSDARARFVATELAALNQLAGKPKTLASAARAYAKEIVARLKVRDLKPSLYESAAARAGKASLDALGKGNRTAAAAEKRNQLINTYAAREAIRAKDEVDDTLAYFARLLRPGAAKSIDPDYLEQILSILDRVDLRIGQSLRAIDKRTSLAEWIEKQRELGFDPIIPDDLLEQLGRRSYKDMSVEELRGLRDAVKNIEHLGRLKNKLLTAKRDRDFARAVGKITDRVIGQAYKEVPALIAKAKGLSGVAEHISSFLIAHRKLAEIARQLDGEYDGGPVWEFFIRPMNDAAAAEVAMTGDASRRFAALTGGLKLSSKLEFVPEIGQSISFEHRLGVALNLGNAVNRERVLAGHRWNDDQLEAVLRPLTAEHWQLVQGIWDFIGSYWPEIAAKERRVTGVEPGRVDPEPLRVYPADGEPMELAGGYYPIAYNRDQSAGAEAHGEAEGWKMAMRGAYTSATTRRGHTKARVESTGWPLRYDLGVVTEHVAQVIHDLTHHEMLIDVNRLLRAPSVDGAIRAHYGPEIVRAFRDTLKATAEGYTPAKDTAERVARALRNNVTIAAMGWNLLSAAQQPLGLTMGVQRVGAKWIALGASHWASNPYAQESTAAWIAAQSPMMANRVVTRLQELNELRGQLTGQRGKIDAIKDSFFYFMSKAQLIADIPTWLGQYAKSTAEGEDHETAVALADQAVLDSQGGGQAKDLAAVQRNPVLAMFTNFMSYQIVVFNRVYNSGVMFRRVGSKHLPRFIVDVMLASLIPTSMSVVLRAALHGEPPDEDDLILQNALFIFSPFVLARDVAGVVQSGGRRDAPVGSFLPALVPLARQAWRDDFEVDESFLRAANKAGGVLLGYPAGQIDKTLRGIEALAEGRTHNPMALVVGPPPKRKAG